MISGAVILDKPSGISSGEYVRKLKPLIGSSKIGHSGTLDPLASGIIIACIGQMTRFSDYLAGYKKRYSVVMKFGIQTSTGDLDGLVINNSSFIPSLENILKCCSKFLGTIEQKPHKYSSVKYKGKPLYFYARRGVDIERKSRKVKIFSIDYISMQDEYLELNVSCGKGTYIRSLVEDLAESLGTCAVVSSLRRTESAEFSIPDSNNIDEISVNNIEKKILPMGDALKCLDKIQCAPEIVDKFKNGQKIEIKEAKDKNKHLRLFDLEENFIGVLQNYQGLVSPKRLISIK